MVCKKNCSNGIVLVNSTAATSGGALTVLKQFIKSVEKYDTKNTYYIFCTVPEMNQYNCNNIHIINDVYKRKWIGRIWWDNFGIEKWLKKNNITPHLIVSLQNTGIRLGRKTKQIIYYHQSLPMYKYKWSLKQKKERILWIYKNIYPWFVKKNFYKSDVLVVQSEWMKVASSEILKIKLDNIIVIKPTLEMEGSGSREIFKNEFKGDFELIYPAADFVFKNHKVIYDALRIITKEHKDIINNIKFYVTLDCKQICKEDIKYIEDNVEFIGKMEYSNLMSLYEKMDLMVFPSYLETVGLPLLEAAYFGIPIITSNLPYAKEVIGGYEGARFVNYDDSKAWANEVVAAYKSRNKYKKFVSNDADTWAQLIELIREQVNKE